MSLEKDITNIKEEMFKGATPEQLSNRPKPVEELRRYTFKIEATGVGHDIEEAWDDAIGNLGMDPGAPPEGNEEWVSSVKLDPDTYEEIE